MKLVDLSHQGEIGLRHRARQIVNCAARNADRVCLPGNAQLVISTNGATLYSLEKATAVSLGAKYVVPGLGTVIGANLHQTRFAMDTMPTIKVSTLGIGVKHPIDNFAVGAQVG